MQTRHRCWNCKHVSTVSEQKPQLEEKPCPKCGMGVADWNRPKSARSRGTRYFSSTVGEVLRSGRENNYLLYAGQWRVDRKRDKVEELDSWLPHTQ